MQMTDQIIHVARAYCEERGLSLARVSTLIFNDGKKLDAIETKGADLSTGKSNTRCDGFRSTGQRGCGGQKASHARQ